jgi:hypothetical protein
MYVLTEIKTLETSSNSCVDRLARSPSHKSDDCHVGSVLGENWKCCQDAPRNIVRNDSIDMFASSGDDEPSDKNKEQRDKNKELDEISKQVELPKNFQVTGPAVWQEKNLMSPFGARPLLIAMIKEGRQTLVPFFKSYLDPEVFNLSHYTCHPHTDIGEFCFWSARGRRVVQLEDCTVMNVEAKTVFKNPINSLTKEVNPGEQNKRKRGIEHHELSSNEFQNRLEAFKYMLNQTKSLDLKVDEEHKQELTSALSTFNKLLK